MAKIEIHKDASIRVTVYGLFMMIAATVVVGNKIESVNSANILWIIVAFLVTGIIHEFTHGLAYNLVGGKPKYGVAILGFMPVAYCAAPKQSFSYRQMLIVALAPLLILTPVFYLLAITVDSLMPYFIVIAVSNFAGAVGDLWLISQMTKYRKIKSVKFTDSEKDMKVSAQPGADTKSVNQIYKTILKKEKGRHFYSLWIKLSIGLILGSLLIPLFLTQLSWSTPFSIGPDWFPIFSYSPPSASGVSIDFNILPIIVVSFFATVIYSWVSRLKKSTVK